MVDGGLINNIPADVLAPKGCNLGIAVNVAAKMESAFVSNRPDTPTHLMRPASTIQTILRSFLVQSVNISSTGIESADIVIEPDLTRFQLTEFSKTAELAAAGELAASNFMDEIRQHLHRLDSKLFPLPATRTAHDARYPIAGRE